MISCKDQDGKAIGYIGKTSTGRIVARKPGESMFTLFADSKAAAAYLALPADAQFEVSCKRLNDSRWIGTYGDCVAYVETHGGFDKFTISQI